MSWVCTRILCLNLNYMAITIASWIISMYSVDTVELYSLHLPAHYMQCSSCVLCTQYDHHIYCLGSLAGDSWLLLDVCYPRLWNTSQICESYQLDICIGQRVYAALWLVGQSLEFLLGYFLCSWYGGDRRWTQSSIPDISAMPSLWEDAAYDECMSCANLIGYIQSFDISFSDLLRI